MQKFTIFKNLTTRRSYIILISVIVFLAYILPVVIHQAPMGTDVYTHVFVTEIMLDSNSLQDFYDKCHEMEFLGYNYPFGVWLFSAIVSKITGIDIAILSYILPLLFLPILIFLYYSYSTIFIDSTKYSLLSVIFFLSMPNISLSLLEYRPSILSMLFLLSSLYLVLNKKISSRKPIIFILMNLLIFCLCFTHTGTYMFLFFFAFLYFFFYVIFVGKFNREAYFLVISLLLVYIITVSIFPEIHPQYMNKSGLVITVGKFLSDKINVDLPEDISRIIYHKIFIDKSFIDVLLWSGFTYAIAELILFIRLRVPKISPTNFFPATLPLFGGITHLPHSVSAIPLWIGPVHSLLSLGGILKLNKRGISFLVSILFVTILPASLIPSYTGVLREIFYLFLIVPITSSLGFSYLEDCFKKFGSMRFISSLLPFLIFAGIFSSLVTMTTIGGIYYKPRLSIPAEDRGGLIWLSEIGNPKEGCVGLGYGHRIDFYANKKEPESTEISHGYELRNFFNTLRGIYLSNKNEDYVDEIYRSYNVKYFISSEKVLKILGSKRNESHIDHNTKLDKIYSCKDLFEIYKKVPSVSYVSNDGVYTVNEIEFSESHPIPKDAGSDFLIETKTYTFRLGKKSPNIGYLGDRTTNLLGEGNIIEYIRLSVYKQNNTDNYFNYVLAEMNFSVSVKDNQIIYKRILGDNNGDERYATLIIKYTFYEKAIKNEIIVANDWLSTPLPMNVYLSTIGFIPCTYLTYENWYGIKKDKRVYPAEDYSRIDDKFKSLFISNVGEGIYFKYDKTSPYPSDTGYKGSLLYNYSLIDIKHTDVVYPADSMHLTRYISIGDAKTAEGNIDEYISISVYPYPRGIIPLILTGYLTIDRLSEVDLNYTLKGYETLEEYGLIEDYTEAMQMNNQSMSPLNKLFDYPVNIMGYGEAMKGEGYTSQREKISMIKKNMKKYHNITLRGFMPQNLKYDIQTVKAALDENITFIEAIPVNSPIAEFYQEGLRSPKFAYYRGDRTNLVLLPVSKLSSSLLKRGDVVETVSAWRSTMDSVIKNDDACILIWRSPDIGQDNYVDYISNLIKYAKDRGMTFTTPENIVKHMILLQNLSVEFSKDVDTAVINVSNRNDEVIKGATFRVILPKIENKCQYIAENSQLSRIVEQPFRCNVYITTDLKEGENKILMILSEKKKGKLRVELIEGPVEGKIKLAIKDLNDVPISDASVGINNQRYLTDINGTVSTELRRGTYLLKVEKPGFEPQEYNLEVKGRIYYLEQIPLWVYSLTIITIVIIVAFVSLKLKKQKGV